MKTISEHVLDIIQNSVRAGARKIEVTVGEDKQEDIFSLLIQDNGCGMDEEMALQAANPFFTSRKTRKVGLGLALLKQNAENASGTFSLKSCQGEGTMIKAVFQHSNIDRPPVGDIWDSLYYTWLSHPEILIIYRHETLKGQFTMDSDEIREMLGDVPIQGSEIRNALVEMIKNNLKEIDATK